MSETWLERAVCRGANPTIFFPGADNHNTVHLYDTARSYCDRCPVRPECLDEALSMPWYSRGLWGGKSMKERQAMPHTVRVQPIKHGTVGGDRAHRRRGERPCENCRRAANAYWCERNGRAG